MINPGFKVNEGPTLDQISVPDEMSAEHSKVRYGFSGI